MSTENKKTYGYNAAQQQPRKEGGSSERRGSQKWDTRSGGYKKNVSSKTDFENQNKERTDGIKQRSQSSAQKTQKRARGRTAQKSEPVTPVRLTMLGGLNEIGKNITLFEYGEDAFLIDCGLAFPDDEMLGVDIVLPDFTHVINNKDRIAGIVLTHGHEDHIGGLPYLLKHVNLPVYGTRLTLALVENKLKESGLAGKVRLNLVSPGDVINFGKVSVEFINVNHSIPDAVALGIKTPHGYVIHTGDYKIDFTPVHGPMIDLPRFGTLGNSGVLALLADSTNSERAGYTPSERVVGESFVNLFHKAENKRIIIATFSSNIHRIKQIIDIAVADGRKVAISGRSMQSVVNIAGELGYLQVPDGVFIDIDTINDYPKDRVILISTGTQGEPMSALTRMAFSDHRKVEVGPDDYIIISAQPIPGNEKTVSRVINELMKRGCDVVFEKMYDVHVSGHACQEELKIMLGLTRPKFFIPVHGEQKHLRKSVQIAKSTGMSPDRTLISDNGKVIEITPDKMEVAGTVQAGRVLVDGLGVGDVGSIVLRDRKRLSEDGLIVVVACINTVSGEIVSGPDIVSRGFVYVRESEQLIEEARELSREILESCCRENLYDWATMKSRVRDELSQMLFGKTKRSPMIIPIIMEI